MKLLASVHVATLAATAIAVPTNTIKRADSCGDWDSVETGSYTVYNNLWGASSATSGSQCFGVDGLDGNTVSWHTS
jgi:xyloglucan-specific endo-beta-1,4-glucanase